MKNKMTSNSLNLNNPAPFSPPSNTDIGYMQEAIYLAKNKMQNMDRALEISYKLSQNKEENAPIWTRQMPAFIYEEMGDGCMAFKVIEKILKESESGTTQIRGEYTRNKPFKNIQFKLENSLPVLLDQSEIVEPSKKDTPF